MVGSNVANVGNWNDDNGLNVNDWNRDESNVNIGAARWIVSSMKLSFAWWNVSIHQAFFLFPVVLFEVQDTFYQLLIDYLLLILTRFLKGQF